MPPDEPTAAAPAAPPATTATEAPPAPEWRASLPAELRDAPSLGKFSDPGALARSYVELETLIGRKGVVVPGEKDPPEVAARFRAALGVPEKPDGYALKAPEGIPEGVWQPEAATAFSAVAHDAGLTPAQAQKLANWWAGAATKIETDRHAEAGATETALRAEWGTAYDGRIERAKRALREFGGEDLVTHLEKSGLGNNAALVRAFAKIGEAVGEDKPAGMGTGRGTLTPSEAKSELAKLERFDAKSAYWDNDHPEHKAAVARALTLREMVV